ncbi:putative Ufm1-specific protease [Platanthera guangdongensis]|uniref:Ufm1-specific protease n=1 Tax=Platanthera guangdongensis TaxID=2320717 RepID=A0ABR2M7S4_9ASPA
MEGGEGKLLRVLCSKKSLLSPREPGLRWLIGSPLFLPRFNIVSSFRCLHYLLDDTCSPNFSREADDIRTLLLRGFDIVGALLINNGETESNARKAAEASCKMRSFLSVNAELDVMIGAVADLNGENLHDEVSKDDGLSLSGAEGKKLRDVPGGTKTLSSPFFLTNKLESELEARYPQNCSLLHTALGIDLSVFLSSSKAAMCERIRSLIDQPFTELKDPHVAFLVQGPSVASDGVSSAIVLHDIDLDSNRYLPANVSLLNNKKDSDANYLVCSQFCSKNKPVSFLAAGENADVLRITVLSNQSRNISKFGVPMAEYFPEPTRCVLASFKLDVLCFSSKDFPVASAISKLVVPGLIDQLTALKKAISPNLLSHHPQLQAYHFLPPGILHPITAVYELTHGEREVEQSEKRRSLHSRLGLPLDRPLLLIANALTCGRKSNNLLRNGHPYLKNVHTQIPSSGVSGGVISLVAGSYEYYHYLLDGIDDNGWGCAYRSLQTIMSWFGLQHYTSVEVPSHREIQQALVEIGDKEPSFVGSHEWIGAVELGFVLDKLLGVSCKIMNVRSGAELPEKCRELTAHFESQGTPVMIGGGVLAYTLLGVDYNEASGDCAFLILDPHYTGNDDLKKIVSGGWCGWKSAVDSKGRSFFLKDKFYNLLLPQRPNMV